ncbi:MAG TPA: sugar ABC transporter ATP-binding protein [Spirochaetia bacterium]|nr:sugar ABC transporter ATP-binding protein [Spirochaetia bacterium]
MRNVLEMRGISKRFPGVLALDHADLSVRSGEIHSLIGQNGAGKSTMMKILSGMYAADAGTVTLEGKELSFRHPREALQKGIVTVYQELSLLPNLTVAENMFLGREPGSRLTVDDRAIRRRSKEIFEQLGIEDIDVDERISDLPLAQRQLVEIAKALSHDLKVLVLDEPTAPLTNEDTEHLFQILNRVRGTGASIIFITHRLREVLAFCDRGTILRNGRTVTTVDVAAVTENQLIEAMIGQEADAFYQASSHRGAISSVPALEVRNLTVGTRVLDVSFQLYPGEIIGVTGLLGAGQNELLRCLFGVLPRSGGSVYRDGREILIHSPREAIDNGICLLTENRKEEGLIIDMSVKENITLPSLSSFRRGRFLPLLNNRRERDSAVDFIRKVGITLRTPGSRMRTLSGGNQQKTIVARWLLSNLDVLLFIEPTRGIDVGAKAEIYRMLSALAAEGKAIMVVSTDHNEILGVSDRILVMYKGRLSRILSRSEAGEEQLLSEIQGWHKHAQG